MAVAPAPIADETAAAKDQPLLGRGMVLLSSP